MMFTVSVNGGCSIRLGAADKFSNKLRRNSSVVEFLCL